MIPDSCRSNFLPFYHHPPHAFLLPRSLSHRLRGRRSCLALLGSAFGSRLHSPYASSPMHQAVSCSTLLYLWTGSSSPVASHPASRRRSYLRLRTTSVLSDGDFHPTVGAHSQAHVGLRSRATGVARLENVPARVTGRVALLEPIPTCAATWISPCGAAGGIACRRNVRASANKIIVSRSFECF